MNRYLLIIKKSFMEKKELMALNENLNAEMTIQQLEERLETDPLTVGGLVEIGSVDVQVNCFSLECESGFGIEF